MNLLGFVAALLNPTYALSMSIRDVPPVDIMD